MNNRSWRAGDRRPGASVARRRAPHDAPRDHLFGRLAEAIESVTTAHPVLVAVDWRLAAGKTTLADELALILHNGARSRIFVSAAFGETLARPRIRNLTPFGPRPATVAR